MGLCIFKPERLKKADMGFYSGAWQTTTSGDVPNISYDANGNIQALQRWELSPSGLMMDNFTYHYQTGKNILDHVDDTVSDGVVGHDLDDQNTGNYTYDLNGNMIEDAGKNLSDIAYDYRNLPYQAQAGAASTVMIDNETFAGTEIARDNADLYQGGDPGSGKGI